MRQAVARLRCKLHQFYARHTLIHLVQQGLAMPQAVHIRHPQDALVSFPVLRSPQDNRETGPIDDPYLVR